MEKLFCVRFLRDVYSGGFRNSHLMLCSKVRKCGKMTWCEYFLDPQRFCVQLRARPGRTGLVIAPYLLSVTRRAKSGLDRVINEKIFPGFRFRHRMLPPPIHSLWDSLVFIRFYFHFSPFCLLCKWTVNNKLWSTCAYFDFLIQHISIHWT